MKIDFAKVLKNFKGEPLKNADEIVEIKNKDGSIKTKAKPATDFTLRDAALNVLLLPALQDRNSREAPVSGKENLDKYLLAEKIHANDIVEIDTTQRDLIKDSTAKVYPAAMISGQIWDMLERTAVVEGKKSEKEEKDKSKKEAE